MIKALSGWVWNKNEKKERLVNLYPSQTDQRQTFPKARAGADTRTGASPKPAYKFCLLETQMATSNSFLSPMTHGLPIAVDSFRQIKHQIACSYPRCLSRQLMRRVVLHSKLSRCHRVADLLLPFSVLGPRRRP